MDIFETGAPGLKGNAGQDGRDGFPGSKGFIGWTGPRGIKGTQGPLGRYILNISKQKHVINNNKIWTNKRGNICNGKKKKVLKEKLSQIFGLCCVLYCLKYNRVFLILRDSSLINQIKQLLSTFICSVWPAGSSEPYNNNNVFANNNNQVLLMKIMYYKTYQSL